VRSASLKNNYGEGANARSWRAVGRLPWAVILTLGLGPPPSRSTLMVFDEQNR